MLTNIFQIIQLAEITSFTFRTNSYGFDRKMKSNKLPKIINCKIKGRNSDSPQTLVHIVWEFNLNFLSLKAQKPQTIQNFRDARRLPERYC